MEQRTQRPRATGTARSRTSVDAPASLTKRVWIIGLNVALIALLVLVVVLTRHVLGWILIALLLAVALDPAVKWLQRRGFRRGWAITTVVLAAAAFVGALLATVVPMAVEQIKNLIAAVPDILENLRQSRLYSWADQQFGIAARIKASEADGAGSAAAPVFSAVQHLLTGVAGAITIVALTIFMLACGGQVFEGALLWVAPAQRQHAVVLCEKIQQSVGRYVIGTFTIASIGGAVTATTLAILGVPYFLPLGLLMVVLGVIPFVGPLMGALLVVGTTFASSGMRDGLIVLGVFLVYQQVENHVLQPLVQRKSIHMNPLIIAVAMLIGTTLAGVLGALLALPIAAAVKVVIEDVLERRERGQRGRPAVAASDRA